jgi:hypothetical protein
MGSWKMSQNTFYWEISAALPHKGAILANHRVVA